MERFTFGKSERLTSRKHIEALFKTGSRLKNEAITLIYAVLQEPAETPLKIAVSVPKKKFKRAVDRNLLKRRMREAIRLNKGEAQNLLKESNISAQLMFIYHSSEILSYQGIEEKIVLLLKDFEALYAHNH